MKRILIVCPDGVRRPLRLGKMSMKQAKTVNVFVEDLCVAARGAKVIENATADWVASMDDTMHARLSKLDLVRPRNRTSTTLGAFLAEYFAGMTGKPNTLIFYRHTRRCLIEFFGENKPLREIEPADADKWRLWLNTVQA